jgi:hypothetical protein
MVEFKLKKQVIAFSPKKWYNCIRIAILKNIERIKK